MGRIVASRQQQGFTLIEVLVAMAVVMIGMLGTAALADININGNAMANHMTVATTLAKDKMEAARSAGYEEADDLAGTEAYGAISGNSAFKRVVTVQTNVPDAFITTVTSTVYWDNDTRHISMTTLIAKEWGAS